MKASNDSKNKFAYAYKRYCDVNSIQWNKPYYKVVEITPLIPSTQNVQAIINNASIDYVTIFTLEAEIGCSPEELHRIKLKDIDQERGALSVTGVKGHASKNYPLKKQTATMLREYVARHQKEHLFPKAHTQSQMWQKFRERAARKLSNPELRKIQLRNLRNYSGEQFYKNLPVRDPIALMQHFRHKKLETTMHYIRAIVLDYEEDDQWISRTSTTIEEDAKLIENGFQYITERNGIKLYRKRK
jgi:integrase